MPFLDRGEIPPEIELDTEFDVGEMSLDTLKKHLERITLPRKRSYYLGTIITGPALMQSSAQYHLVGRTGADLGHCTFLDQTFKMVRSTLMTSILIKSE